MKGLSKKEREAKGERGGVVGLIFIAGFLVEDGMSVKDTLPGGVLESTDEVCWIISLRELYGCGGRPRC